MAALRTDVGLQLTATRLLAAALIVAGLLAGIGGTDDLLRESRRIGAAFALVVALLAAIAFTRGEPGRPRLLGAAGAGFAVGAVLGGGSTALLGQGDWAFAAGVSTGLALALRVGFEAQRRAHEDALPAATPDDAYAAHVRRLRGRGTEARQARAADRAGAELVRSRIALVTPLVAGAGLLGVLAGSVLAPDVGPASFPVAVLLILFTGVLFAAMTIGGVLLALPLAVVTGAARGRARRGAARASGLQPLPDVLASALATAVMQVSLPKRERAT
jgi:hypothetical protein